MLDLGVIDMRNIYVESYESYENTIENNFFNYENFENKFTYGKEK